MKTLIVKDNLTAQRLLDIHLRPLGDCDLAMDGQQAMLCYYAAVKSGKPYKLICLDIQLPDLDGFGVLEKIREEEALRGILLGNGVKIIMTTSYADSPHVMQAFRERCDGYLVKPVSRKCLLELLLQLDLLKFCASGMH
jgi:two-component system, chemotaxis family, chemotaxis protein CheY